MLLQYLFGGPGPIRIVPLLVGSFADCVQAGQRRGRRRTWPGWSPPCGRPRRRAGEPVCYVISGDLAHIGPKFGDPEPVAEPHPGRQPAAGPGDCSTGADRRRRGRATSRRSPTEGDAPPHLRPAADVPGAGGDAGPGPGGVLHYQQYVHPDGSESVSFASMAFYA